MVVKIFQIEEEKDKNRLKFMDKSWLERKGFKVDPSIYKQVWSGRLDCHSLEDVFTLTNTGVLYTKRAKIEKPVSYTARSLSVSDIVQVVSSNDVKPGFYFCDFIGFKKLDLKEIKL